MASFPALPARSFCLIRHGETTANRDQIIAGRLDVALTDLGRQQASLLKEISFPEPIALFCSPMDRAIKTASLGFPDTTGQVVPNLRERDWGVFEGCPLSELPPRDSTPPQGEGWRDMILRVHAAITWCCTQSPGALPVLVCHSGVIRATRLLAQQTGVGTRPANATPLLFKYHSGKHIEQWLDHSGANTALLR